MGSQSQEQQQKSSAVFYDPAKQQYYTIQNPQSSDPLGNIFGNSPLLGLVGGLTGGNLESKYRNYLGNSLIPTSDRFTPKNIEPNYPDMNELFPALNAGLAQNLQQSLLAPTDTQSSGAGRFIAPSNTSQGK
jgi:hypothetical protein